MSGPRLEFLAAEAGIRQLQARCSDSVWRKDLAAFGDCFTEDAEWRIGGRVLLGRVDCVGFLEAILPHIRRVLITMQTPILDVTGDTAIGRTYLSEANARESRAPVFPIGVYYDRFVRQNERWRFCWHHYQSFYYGPVDLSGPLVERADYGAPFGMPGAQDPAPLSLAFEP